jgi:hypothetical protein
MNRVISSVTALSVLAACLIVNPAIRAQSGVAVSNAYLSILSQRMALDRRKAMNEDRQKKLESDTKKLVDLVNDLNQQMQGEQELTPLDLSRRAAEIERLAHDVQDRMKG